MKRKTTPVAIVFFMALLPASCQKKGSPTGTTGPDAAVQFTAVINDGTSSNASGNVWSAGDSIGVFMSAASGGTRLAANKKYTTTGNGNFTAQGSHAISYPEDGSLVNFSAYYPYKPAVTGAIYKVNLADQSNPQAIDLMYSGNATGFSKASTGSPNLNLEHQLARVTLTVRPGNGTTLDGLKASFLGQNTLADFDLGNGTLSAGSAPADIAAKITAGSNSPEKLVTAILLPLANATDKKILMTLPSGGTYTFTFPAGTKFEKGKSYSYIFTLQNDPLPQLLLDMNYEDATLNGGISAIEATHATAADAAYLVSPGATGSHAIAHKITYGDSAYFSDGSWRSESSTSSYKPGRFFPDDERRYECSILLKDWVSTINDPTETNIFQLKVSGNSTTGSGVPLQVRVARNALLLRFSHTYSLPSVKILPDVMPYINQWVHFRVDVKWTDNATGHIKTYMKLPGQNDYLLVDEKNNLTTFAGDAGIGNVGYIKWGAYITPKNVTRVVYHDDIRIYKLN